MNCVNVASKKGWCLNGYSTRVFFHLEKVNGFGVCGRARVGEGGRVEDIRRYTGAFVCVPRYLYKYK